MHFNLALLKEHPYATGGVVIVGAIVVFFLLSSSQGSSAVAATNPASSDDADLANVQAAAQVQTNAQQVQLAQTQLEAGVENNQTQASVDLGQVQTAAQLAASLASIAASVQTNDSDNFAAITEQANQEVSNENIYGMQEGVLLDQINAGVAENANNNATNLAGTEYGDTIQGQVALTSLDDATKLATQGQTIQQQQEDVVAGLAGKDIGANGGVVLSDILGDTQTAGAIAVSGNAAQASETASDDAEAASNTKAIVGGISSGLQAIATGLFA